MKFKKLFLVLVVPMLIYSCDKSDESPEKQYINKSYTISKATAELSLDLNADGSASNDLMQELPNLNSCLLSLKTANLKKDSMLVDQTWPIPHFSGADSSIINYLHRSNIGYAKMVSPGANTVINVNWEATAFEEDDFVPENFIIDADKVSTTFYTKFFVDHVWQTVKVSVEYNLSYDGG